jgi:hypothetical protein
MKYPLFIIEADSTTVLEVEGSVTGGAFKFETTRSGHEAMTRIMSSGGRSLWLHHPDTGAPCAIVVLAASVPDEAAQRVAQTYFSMADHKVHRRCTFSPLSETAR